LIRYRCSSGGADFYAPAQLCAPCSTATTLKRFYFIDYLILRLIFVNGYGYSKFLALRLNKTRRCVNKHLHKLADFGLILRIGHTRCPFQWYKPTNGAINVLRALEDLWRKYPQRHYFTIMWYATVPCLEGRVGALERASSIATVPCLGGRVVFEFEFWIPLYVKLCDLWSMLDFFAELFSKLAYG